MMCVVTKDFTGAGESYIRNQLVDGSAFRNEQVLITTRYLRPASVTEIETARYEDVQERPARRLPPHFAKGAKTGLKAKIAKR